MTSHYAHLLSADRTVPHRAACKPFFLLSALCSCEHLPAPQIGRTLCQVCPQMAPWCSHRELHALLVRRLRRKRQPLWDARGVSAGVRETRYTSSLSPGFARPIISEIKTKRKQSCLFYSRWIPNRRSCGFTVSVGTFPVWTGADMLLNWLLLWKWISFMSPAVE